MTDRLSKEQRSRLMARVKSRDTKPEKQVRKLLWRAGFRYRLNVRSLPGTPDIVLRKHRAAVLVQGCFWHSHDCERGRKRPAANAEYWSRKLDGNAARDARNQALLKELGWTTYIVWECELPEAACRLLAALRQSRCRTTATAHKIANEQPQ